MTKFNVETVKLSIIASALKKHASKLDDAHKGISEVKTELGKQGSYWNEVCNTLDTLMVRTKNNSKETQTLGTALASISKKYRDTEYNVNGRVNQNTGDPRELARLIDEYDEQREKEEAEKKKKGLDLTNEESRDGIRKGLKKYYDNNAKTIENMECSDTGKFDYDKKKIKEVYEANKELYQRLSAATGVPPELICAIHYRESGCDFNTYLHNGEKLGKPTTMAPENVFYEEGEFEEAAIHALKNHNDYTKITFDENTDMATYLTYAELFNGAGYALGGHPNPYLYSGTSAYSSGKYISDTKYDPDKVDDQPGIYLLLNALMEE